MMILRLRNDLISEDKLWTILTTHAFGSPSIDKASPERNSYVLEQDLRTMISYNADNSLKYIVRILSNKADYNQYLREAVIVLVKTYQNYIESLAKKSPDEGIKQSAKDALKLADTALINSQEQIVQKGGIDLDSAKMQLNVSKQGQGVKMEPDQAIIDQIKLKGFDGLEFTISSVEAVPDLPVYLGVPNP